MNILFIGPSGSGKDTQSQLLVEKYNFTMISTGELLREEVAAQTEIGKRAKEYLQVGKFVPDEIVYEVMETHFDEHISERTIFNGAVRRFNQVALLDTVLARHNLELTHVVYFDLDEETAVKRLLNRGRSDDTLESIKSRLSEFKKSHEQIIDSYTKRGIFISIDASQSVERIRQEVVTKLELVD